MIFKAKLSPKQMVQIDNTLHKAINGQIVTDDPVVIKALKRNIAFDDGTEAKKGKGDVDDSAKKAADAKAKLGAGK